MATFTHYLQGTTPTTIDATDTFQFAGGVFNGKVTVDEYNDSSHVKTSIGGDKSAANTPNNVKYISVTEADWGAGTEDLVNILEAECTLKINFANDPAVSVEDAIFYAYDGTTPATPPVDVTTQVAELGDTDWVAAGGSGAALGLGDQGSGTSHDYFISISAKPTAVGAKTGKYRIELTYF